jgi:hypothetical protein
MATTSQHPDLSVPADQLAIGYAEVLRRLADNEPEALERALKTVIESAPADLPGESTTITIARAWMPSAPPSRKGRRYGFSYPAHVAFDITEATSPDEATQIARASIQTLLSTNEALATVDGSHPDAPQIRTLVVWLGSSDGADADVLELEEYTE